MGELFSEDGANEEPIARFSGSERLKFEGGVKLRVTPPSFNQLEVLLGEFLPGGTTGASAYAHRDSEETITVLSGEVFHEIDGEVFHLKRFDSARYRSSQMHRTVEATGVEKATVLWSISPPTY